MKRPYIIIIDLEGDLEAFENLTVAYCWLSNQHFTPLPIYKEISNKLKKSDSYEIKDKDKNLSVYIKKAKWNNAN